jgi:hypothetical protein
VGFTGRIGGGAKRETAVAIAPAAVASHRALPSRKEENGEGVASDRASPPYKKEISQPGGMIVGSAPAGGAASAAEQGILEGSWLCPKY